MKEREREIKRCIMKKNERKKTWDLSLLIFFLTLWVQEGTYEIQLLKK